MTNLTDKWKKGELKEGLYWVKHDGIINILDELEIALTDVDEILDEVPSYDLWKSLNENMDSVMQTNKALAKWCEEFNALDVAKENTKLKELLKECKEYFDNMSPDFDSHDFDEIISKIDQALADNKIQANTVACNKIQENE